VHASTCKRVCMLMLMPAHAHAHTRTRLHTHSVLCPAVQALHRTGALDETQMLALQRGLARPPNQSPTPLHAPWVTGLTPQAHKLAPQPQEQELFRGTRLSPDNSELRKDRPGPRPQRWPRGCTDAGGWAALGLCTVSCSCPYVGGGCPWCCGLRLKPRGAVHCLGGGLILRHANINIEILALCIEQITSPHPCPCCMVPDPCPRWWSPSRFHVVAVSRKLKPSIRGWPSYSIHQNPWADARLLY